MATFANGKIEAYVGPTELKAADNLETVIVEYIAGAKESLDIAVQEIDSMPIAEAILDARWRGAKIEAFVEQDYLKSKLKALPDPPTPEPGETPEVGGQMVEDYLDSAPWARNREHQDWEDTPYKAWQERPEVKKWRSSPEYEAWGRDVGQGVASRFRASWHRSV